MAPKDFMSNMLMQTWDWDDGIKTDQKYEN